jgi:hypothetical protein
MNSAVRRPRHEEETRMPGTVTKHTTLQYTVKIQGSATVRSTSEASACYERLKRKRNIFLTSLISKVAPGKSFKLIPSVRIPLSLRKDRVWEDVLRF